MRLARTKYKRATPKSLTEYSDWKLDLGGGFVQLLRAVAKTIEKIFGILYMSKSNDVLI